MTAKTLIGAALGLMLGTLSAQAATLTFDQDGQCSNADVMIRYGIWNDPTCPVDTNPSTGGKDNALYAAGETAEEDFWTAFFTSAVGYVSVELGDLGGLDSDVIYLSLYDAQGTEITTLSRENGLAKGLFKLEYTALDNIIRTAVFGTSAGNGGILADNFTYGQVETSPVPVPAAGGLLVLGLGALAALRRKR